jgi:hypothetical protein
MYKTSRLKNKQRGSFILQRFPIRGKGKYQITSLYGFSYSKTSKLSPSKLAKTILG